ncbi:MAG: T9SS type A sorting domain-containing protein [Bacteroidia bacterium]
MTKHKLTQRTGLSLNNRFVKVLATGLVLAGILMVTDSGSTSISGVINTYAAVTAIGTQTITVSSSSGFSTGDKILLIQMKGAIISEADDASYGNISNFGNAGNYEFHTIANKSSKTFTLAEPICGDYTVSDLVQVVRVPVYSDVTVSGTLRASDWDGTKGGILALEATGTLKLKSDLDVRTNGFRGGDLNGSAHTGGLTYICAFNSGEGGIKGEGITEIAQAACRGKLANGGGGGNDHNGGGGGGGNYGSGGIGGHGWKSNTPGNLSDLDKGGRGGAGLADSYNSGIPKLFLGGGGGGGHQNNGASVPAANGAGIVIIIANTINVDRTVTIKANALDATDVEVNDGAGGGGAGGSVLLDVQNFSNSNRLSIDVSGGEGASVITRDQHGPGGGGAGGYINTTHSLPNDVTISLTGGIPGLFISDGNPSNPNHNTPHGATAGQDGAIIGNLVLQTCSAPPVIDLDNGSAGEDFDTLHVLQRVPTLITNPSKLDIEDSDDIAMEIAIIEINNVLNDTSEKLGIIGDLPSGITATLSSDKHTLTLQGSAPISDYLTAISKISYVNTSTNPDKSPRMISIYVNDGGAESNTANITLNFLDGTFPVEWLGFTAENRNGSNYLEWHTAREQNSDFFEIQRSGDGNDFKPLERVKAAGFSDKVKSYSYTDKKPASAGSSTIYYRLRQVDFDGAQDYSTIVEISMTGATGNALKAFPNPATDQVTIEASHSSGTSANISVVDMQGRTIWTQPISANEPVSTLQINVSDWSPGTYIIRLQGQGAPVTQKLIVR